MKQIITALTLLLATFGFSKAYAQDYYDVTGRDDSTYVQKKLSRQERKALQQRIDSMQWAQAMEAVNDTAFTLEADQVIFKYGQRAYVSSSTNFVQVDKRNATVQVAFNVPVAGPNGMGGVTLDGTVTEYSVSNTKKGDITFIKLTVMGVAISSSLQITLYKGSDKAQVTIMPNFNSHRITLSGRLLPKDGSFVMKGRSI